VQFEAWQIWTVILGLGLGTYLIRLSFLGLIGNRPLPPMVMRFLRYTPMAVIPGLVAPAVVWPAATAGVADPARMIAALVTVVVGIVTRKTLWALGAGITTLVVALWLLG
jgi:branched-subunit amino acid transport protein